MEHLKLTLLKGMLLTLHTIKTIKLVLSMTIPLRTNFKSRQVAKPGPNVIKLFLSVIYELS